jgi:hypothetical protein
LTELADAADVTTLKSMGHILQYAEKMNLAAMMPRPDLASTKYCLANPGSAYLIYQPEPNKLFAVNLIAGNYSFEWFNPGFGTVVSDGLFTTEAGNKSFSAPFDGDAVLYLQVKHKDTEPR